jgi:hypothetical protein
VPKVFLIVAYDLCDDANGSVENFYLLFKTSHVFSTQPYPLLRSDVAIAFGDQVEFQGFVVQNVGHSIGS